MSAPEESTPSDPRSEVPAGATRVITLPLAHLEKGHVVFGRYELQRELGRGGMGVVWAAFDRDLERAVALKFLPEAVAVDAEAMRDLKRETKLGLELTHTGIVRIFNLEREPPLAAIIMELVDGESLASRKIRSPGGCLGTEELAPLAAQLCAALHYAHEEGRVVHRDLKPGNILVTHDGKLKITDFGIARSLVDTRSRLTNSTGMTSGTLLYMSPQQLRGKRPTPADDIYALGATLYELLTGKPPFFRGNIDAQVMHELPEPMGLHRAEVGADGPPIPPHWETTIRACLAKEPADRPASAMVVAEWLGVVGMRSGSRPATEPSREAARPGTVPPLITPPELTHGVFPWREDGPGVPPPPDSAAPSQAGSASSKRAAGSAAPAPPPASVPDLGEAPTIVADPRLLEKAAVDAHKRKRRRSRGRWVLIALAVFLFVRFGPGIVRHGGAKGGVDFVVEVDPAGDDAEVTLGGDRELAEGGLAKFAHVPVGDLALKVEADGYETYTARVDVPADGEGRTQVKLVPSQTSPADKVAGVVQAAKGVIDQIAAAAGRADTPTAPDHTATPPVGDTTAPESEKSIYNQLSFTTNPGKLKPEATGSIQLKVSEASPDSVRAALSWDHPLDVSQLARRPIDLANVDVQVDGEAVEVDRPLGDFLLVRHLEPGKHTLLVRHPDYKDWTAEVDLSADEPARLSASLEGKPGDVSFSTTPGGAVVTVSGGALVDATFTAGEDKHMVTTPFHVPLPPGKYQARFKLEGYAEKVQEFVVSPNRSASVSVALEPGGGSALDSERTLGARRLVESLLPPDPPDAAAKPSQ